MKHLKLDDLTKELAGFVDLTPAEQLEEEEKREGLLKEPTLLTILQLFLPNLVFPIEGHLCLCLRQEEC